MTKSKKELAFLRDLTITKDWTERFTNFTDKHLSLPKKGRFLYFNAGTLSHALKLREKLNKDVEMICVCENSELQKIAEAKATVMKAKISFKKFNELESEYFETVLADLSFVRPDKLSEVLGEIVYLTKKSGKVLFFLPTAGSYGEIFSFLWETFLGVDLIEQSGEIERLISEIQTVFQVEDLAQEAGLNDLSSETNIEFFEYENGTKLINSTLLSDFLFPVWMDFLSESSRKKAIKKLAQIINQEHDHLTFRFSVKATLVSGTKS